MTSSYRAAFLKGEHIYLRPVEKEDLPLLYAWANDARLRRLTGEVRPSAMADVEEYYDKVRSDPSRVWFAIVLLENQRLIGECGLLRMYPPWRTTDLSIILGENSTWGKGYGTEALSLLLDYAFGSLNFHRVAIGVIAANERALHFYEKAGFKREGVQRDGYFHDHAYQDFVMLSILEDEFRSLQTQSREGF
jgi:diamine N-acetyltransferase